MTACCCQDALYPQYQESETHKEDDTNEQQSHNEDDTVEEPSSPSDDDSDAVPNAIVIVNKDMKQMHKMHRLASSSSTWRNIPE